VLLAHLGVRRRQHEAIGQDTIAGKLSDLAAARAGEQEQPEGVTPISPKKCGSRVLIKEFLSRRWNIPMFLPVVRLYSLSP
jgi:hypothetical protein